MASQLFSLTGGQLQESPYDALFTKLDESGNLTTRVDLLTAVIDWWDHDIQRTEFDRGTLATRSGGSGVEDDVGGAAYRMITVMVKARERRIRLAAPGGRVTRDKSYIGQRRCTEISTLMRSLQLVFRF